jgi:hypothetical protein
MLTAECSKSPQEDLVWPGQKRCGSARPLIVVTSMTPTGEIGRAKFPKEPVFKTCLTTGSALFAALERRCSDLLEAPAQWRSMGDSVKKCIAQADKSKLRGRRSELIADRP